MRTALNELSQFGENVLSGNDVSDALKPILNFRSKLTYYLGRETCLQCLRSCSK